MLGRKATFCPFLLLRRFSAAGNKTGIGDDNPTFLDEVAG